MTREDRIFYLKTKREVLMGSLRAIHSNFNDYPKDQKELSEEYQELLAECMLELNELMEK